MSKSDAVIAVDIGGTKFIVAVVNENGEILSRVYCRTFAEEGPHKVIRRLIISMHNVMEKFTDHNIRGICIAAAGTIDSSRGVVVESPNLMQWRNVKLRGILADEFEIPVYLLNDASAAALGEYKLGNYGSADNLIYLTISTGIGGGIIIGGKLYEGSSGCAGEIGHTIIKADGPMCKCGQQGCLEALASGTAIARYAREKLAKGSRSMLIEMADGNIDNITAETVTKAARKGDALALAVVNTAAGYLGIGLANVINIFNPDVVVVGGGVSKMGEIILKPARASMKRHAFTLPARTVRVVKSRLGADAGVLGAAVYVHQKWRD